MNFAELKKTLYAEIKKFVPDFQMSITMNGLRVIRVFVLGNVKAPGTYTISSLSTMINALFSCGGPTKSGTMRKIQLIRQGKVIKTLDLYNFLLKGDKSQDERLKDEDTIFVPLIGEVVGIGGSVKMPAIYEMKDKSTLNEMLKQAGGVLPISYLRRVQLVRIKAHEKKILVDLDLFPIPGKKEASQLKTLLQDRDLIIISPILPKLQNVVELEGHLIRPGTYQFKKGMRISDFIGLSENLLPEPYLEYGRIIRQEPPDFHERILPFNLGKMLKKDPEHDLKLKRLDHIKVFSKWDMENRHFVKISGEVRREGQYPLKENLRISNLIYQAGDLTNDAYTYKGRIIGHHMGTNATDLFIRTTHYIHDDWLIGLDFDRERKSWVSNTTISNPTSQIKDQWGTDITYMGINDLRIKGNYRYESTKNNQFKSRNTKENNIGWLEIILIF